MKCTFGTSCAFLPAKNFMVSSFFGGLKVPPICEKNTCRADFSISNDPIPSIQHPHSS